MRMNQCEKINSGADKTTAIVGGCNGYRCHGNGFRDSFSRT